MYDFTFSTVQKNSTMWVYKRPYITLEVTSRSDYMPEHHLRIVCYHGQIANPGTKRGFMRIEVQPSDKFVAIVRACCVDGLHREAPNLV